ncbi:MAG TPA: ATP synthase F1 subunit epsilon [Bacteroidales bacterium]|nr:ATP synthase F1 subunit epsilon [Bacteroidales bacterium]HRZ48044.1 ATP synthase F1 subunit epsilon [Bacteroidales bacterium]
MQLTIISPDQQLYEGTVTLVQFPGTEGSFEVLPGHTRMIVTLGAGEIRIVQSDQKTIKVSVKGGVVEIKDDRLLVLAS